MGGEVTFLRRAVHRDDRRATFAQSSTKSAM
jgi:hypothetical protein